MKSLRKILILLLSLSITTSCDKPNVLTEYSNTDSDEALYLEAVKKMDSSDWDGAITIMTTTMSSDYRAQTKVKEKLMHAYGGKCGISFFDLINGLKSAVNTEIFKISLELFVGKTVDVTACDNAVATLLSIGSTAATRTADQNLFAAILGLTRFSTTLHDKLDTESSGLGDGAVDAGADFCTDSSATNRLSDDEINRIASGIGLVFENLAVLGDELTSGPSGSALDGAKTLCETPIALPAIGTPASYGLPPGVWTDYGLPASPTYQDFGLPADIADPMDCLNTVADNVTPKMRRIIRRMIASSDLGFNTCDISDVTVSVTAPGGVATLTVNSNCCPALTSP